MFPSFHKITVFLALVLPLAFPHGVQGQVLCIGTDGHWAVESAHFGICCDGDMALAIPVEYCEQDMNCGACFDLPILGASMMPTNFRNERIQSITPSPAPPVLWTASVDSFIGYSSFNQMYHKNTLASGNLKCIRTVAIQV